MDADSGTFGTRLLGRGSCRAIVRPACPVGASLPPRPHTGTMRRLPEVRPTALPESHQGTSLPAPGPRCPLVRRLSAFIAAPGQPPRLYLEPFPQRVQCGSPAPVGPPRQASPDCIAATARDCRSFEKAIGIRASLMNFEAHVESGFSVLGIPADSGQVAHALADASAVDPNADDRMG